jgi:hypothetical protein
VRGRLGTAATSAVVVGAAVLGTLAAVPLVATIAIVATRVALFRSTAARIARLVGARRMLRAAAVAVVTTGATVAASRPGGAWCRGEERSGGVGSWLAHGEFLEEELGAGLEERRERLGATKMDADGDELLVEPADDIEDERTVGDVLTETTHGINHGLEAAAVVADGEVTLDEGAELSVQENGVLLLVVEELGLHNEPDDSCRDAWLEDGLHEIVGDCPVDP